MDGFSIRAEERVILDTDIGTDCDDAGALRMTARLCRARGSVLSGVIVNASAECGPGAADGILEYEGMRVPIGKTARRDLFPEEERYIRFVAERFSSRYRAGELAVPDAAEVYRELLTSCPDGTCVILAIGFLNTVREIMAREPALFARKVRALVVMAGNWDEPEKPEWNVLHDIDSARYVFSRCPCPIRVIDARMGAGVLTGFDAPDADDPVAEAYRLFTAGGMKRDSWDPITVDYAFDREGTYRLLPASEVEIAEDGGMRVTVREDGRVRFVRFRDDGARAHAIARIDGILREERI